LDLTVADWIRRRQFDGVDAVPADVRSTEQMYAQAVTRMAEVYLSASPEQRGAQFSTEMLYTAPLDTDELAVSVYDALVPRTAIPAPNAHLLHTKDGEPVLLDGEEIDRDPGARLASAAQRIALAFRDRHCTYPGCTRPPTWSLHAHHKTAFRDGGATTVKNLSLLCSEHHTVVHQPGRS
jgi:HNH endonuclease